MGGGFDTNPLSTQATWSAALVLRPDELGVQYSFHGDGAGAAGAVSALSFLADHEDDEGGHLPMDLHKAAIATLPLIELADLPDDHPEYGKKHLQEMVANSQLGYQLSEMEP